MIYFKNINRQITVENIHFMHTIWVLQSGQLYLPSMKIWKSLKMPNFSF